MSPYKLICGWDIYQYEYTDNFCPNTQIPGWLGQPILDKKKSLENTEKIGIIFVLLITFYVAQVSI